MSRQSGLARRSRHWVLTSGMVIAVSLISLLLTACTREELVSALATVSVDLQATLVPLSETVEAGGLLNNPTAEPVIIVTVPPLSTNPALGKVTATATAITATDLPRPTAIRPATATPRPSPTPQPSPTPLPTEIELGGSVMVLVPGGFFKMGAAAADIQAECNTFRSGCEANWFAASEPAHTVLVAPFYIDQFEVTNLDFLAFLNDPAAELTACGELGCVDPEQSQLQPSDSGGYQIAPELATNPVAGVSWFAAAAYCEWRESRLPTEAEWEKAALWNPETATSFRYPWGDEFDGARVNFCDVNCDAPQANPDYDDGFAESAPAGSLQNGRSPSGTYDIAGNLWEWVADWYDEGYYATASTANPQGPSEGEDKVVRGGSYFDTGNFTSGLIRFPSAPDNTDRTIGFRCATSGR